ncbi:HNH endonuclease [Streptomyces sp. NPDC058067]|uniref:HNH endonuclease n=1 Tax=Streptomyces sp. NPDC058067 TaxID=3346324 RepID=UPI0036ED041B
MEGLTAPPAWETKTQRTLDAVKAAMAGNTERVFTAHWSEDAVRDLLLDLVGGKCWYCETLILRADVNVDHFRPKSEVLDVPGHQGYWWLAYEVSNYRIACKHCNSGGARFDGVPEGRAKGSQFPLLAGTRARDPQDKLKLEQPLFLDPARRGDPDLIGFDTSGHARRSHAPYSLAEAKGGVCRAEETIRILALNDSRIITQRSSLMREVTMLARLLGADPEVQQVIDDKVGPEAPWSSAAATALALQRACDQHIAVPAQPSSGSAGTAAIDPNRSYVDLRDLLQHLDLDDLAAGIALTGAHNKKVHHAVLDSDGWINIGKRPYRNPTTAARAVSGNRQIDGWTFWGLTIAGVQQTLADFRAKHVPPNPPA